jgi:thioredoxin reductase (NADPH)
MNLKAGLLERGPLGGQLLNTELIQDNLAFESIPSAELALRMAEHARRFGLEVHEFRPVSEARVEGELKLVRLDDRGELHAPAPILATGALPRRLGVPGEAELAGRGVSYCAVCRSALKA